MSITRSESLAKLAVAKAQAQTKFLPLGKDKSATVQMKAGGSYSYSYADLASCLESVIPALSEAGIALFQPVRVEDGFAIATTLLVHGESGEWISADYASPVVEGRDARSVGSAATYARRYGLLAMLAIASTDEDDDGEQARGGAHEMATAKADPPCPICGVAALIKGREEYGGGTICFRKKGGCGAKWPEGVVPTAGDPPDIMPRQTVRAPVSAPEAPRATAPPPAGAVQPPMPRITPTGAQGFQEAPADLDTQSDIGDRGEAPSGRYPRAPGASPYSMADQSPGDGSPVRFSIGPQHFETAGCTKIQMTRLFALCPQVNRKKGKGYVEALLREEFKVDTRKDLTEAQAERYIAMLDALNA